MFTSDETAALHTSTHIQTYSYSRVCLALCLQGTVGAQPLGGADLGAADPLPGVRGQIRPGSAGRHHGAIPVQHQTQASCAGNGKHSLDNRLTACVVFSLLWVDHISVHKDSFRCCEYHSVWLWQVNANRKQFHAIQRWWNVTKHIHCKYNYILERNTVLFTCALL